MNLSRAIRHFDIQMRADDKSQHTRLAYLRDLKLFQKWLGNDKDVSRVKPVTIARFFTSDQVKLTVDGKSKEAISINRMKTSIRVFFHFLYESGYLKKNPAHLIKDSKIARKIPDTISVNDIKKLLSVIKRSRCKLAKRDYVIISLLLGTGIRLGSMVDLNCSDVLLKQGIIKIRTKGNGKETVFINLELKRILNRYLKSLNPNTGTPLFQSTTGRRLGTRQVQQRVAFWFKRAGIDKASVHTLRHTFATRLYEKTHDLYLVQKALGHRQITSTEIYTRLSDKSLKQAIKLL